jgi:hypothetical protein
MPQMSAVILDRAGRSCLPFDVRFDLKAIELLRSSEMTRRAKERSLDHLIRDRDQLVWNSEAKGFVV